MKPVPVDKIIQQLWFEEMPPGIKVYAIIDGARNEKIYPAVKECTLEWACLYLGKIAPELEQVAPYLVKLEKENPLTTQLAMEGWADHWGIYFWAPAELEDLRHHFRKFLTVSDESGKQFVFRYYDPRVFRAFLPTCLPAEAEALFGPVQEFIVPGKEPSALIRFRMEEGQLIQQQQTL